MNPLEIILIIIAIIIIIISCILVDRSQSDGNQPVNKATPFQGELSDEDRIMISNKINGLLSDITEETVVRTDDALSKLSNEKIMAVNEFSDQILEKINKNHEEVVFLYSMLNDKEKELKAAVKEIDSSKKKVQEMIESKKENEKTQPTKSANKSHPVSKATQVDKMKTVLPPMEGDVDAPVLNILNSNNNSQILALYSQGKSVMEISKLLGLGQGEVKLVIDLFKGKK